MVNIKQIILIYFFLAFIHPFKLTSLQAQHQELSQNLNPNGGIGPGRGYSRDRQQMSPIVCFNAKASPYSKAESIVRFDQGSSFQQVQNSIKIDVSTKVNIGLFSVEADLQYMKEVKDTDYSLSINYYQLVQSEITMEMGYGPAGALTLDGLRAYGSIDNPNPRFGLICGERFISSYKVGATLLFSIKLHFHTHTEKDTFSAKFGVKFGPFSLISTSIQKTAQQTNSSGEVHILAYQSGGNPAELSKILNSSCGQSYCAASCSMLKMTDCSNSINGLLKYAINNFPNQVNVQDQKTMSPFSIGFANMQDVKWIGLNTPPSFVTSDVVAMRQKIGNITIKHQYYYDTLLSLMQAKLPWVKTSKLYNEINGIWSISKFNMDMIMDQNNGGIICYNDPEGCTQNGNELLSRLKEYSNDSFNYVLSSIRYKLSIDICSTTFYRVGETNNWAATNIDPKCSSFNVKSFNVLAQSMTYSIDVVYRGDSTLHSYIGDNIHSHTEYLSFSGTRHHKWGSNDVVENISVPRITSEYYFALYS